MNFSPLSLTAVKFEVGTIVWTDPMVSIPGILISSDLIFVAFMDI